MSHMGGCRPAIPFQRPGTDAPVGRLVRRQHPKHLGNCLVDVSAVHRAHAEEPSSPSSTRKLRAGRAETVVVSGLARLVSIAGRRDYPRSPDAYDVSAAAAEDSVGGNWPGDGRHSRLSNPNTHESETSPF